MRIASWGHAVFAVTLVALGVAGLIQGHFTSTWTGAPRSLHLNVALTYVSAAISIGCGIGLLFARTALLAARVLLSYLLLWLVLFRVSHIAFALKSIDTWWGLGDTAVMLAAAWVLYGWFADAGQALPLGRALYALALIPFGIAHFTNLNDTAPLVPAWLPWHVGLAYFTGAAFIAASIAVLTGVLGRLAATLSALQLGL